MGQSVSPARRWALTILGEILDRGKFASDQIHYYCRTKNLSEADRGLLTQMIYGVLRHKGTLDHFMERWTRPAQTRPVVLHLLRMALYQYWFLDRVPDYAVQYDTVELAKKKGGPALGNFANAVLRKAQEERTSILEDWREAEQALAGAKEWGKDQISQASWVYSVPVWLVNKWVNKFSIDQLINILKISNEVPPVDLRINRRHFTQEFDQEVHQKNLGKLIEDGSMLRMRDGHASLVQQWVQKGWVSIQDQNSFKVVKVLDPQSGEKGMDVCCGHGGKASAIVEITQEAENLWVYDLVEAKIEELKNNFSRLALDTPKTFSPKNPKDHPVDGFDWILIDAPCSGLGTLWRRPEIRWRATSGSSKTFGEKQLKILQEWESWLKPGGRILYSVCSLEPEEGEQVVESFLKDHGNFEEFSRQILFPGTGGSDGFFLSQITRKS